MNQVPAVFNEYIAMWKNYVNFNDRTNQRGFWMAVLWSFCASVVLRLIGGIFDTDILQTFYGLASIVPMLAISTRRLRDTGKPWQYLLFLLIPVVGQILLIVWLAQPSIPGDDTPVV